MDGGRWVRSFVHHLKFRLAEGGNYETTLAPNAVIGRMKAATCFTSNCLLSRSFGNVTHEKLNQFHVCMQEERFVISIYYERQLCPHTRVSRASMAHS